MNSGIYMLLNLVTNMYYIGSVIRFNKRWRQHRSDLNLNKHTNSYLQHAWNKHGEENFKFYVLELVADKSKLLEREQFWLDHSRCYDINIGYNLNLIAASSLGIKRSEYTKAKMSLANKGKKLSEEHKLRISRALIGRKRTLKALENIKAANRKPKSEDHRKKIAIANRTRIWSKESKLKMSLSAKKAWIIKKNDLDTSIG